MSAPASLSDKIAEKYGFFDPEAMKSAKKWAGETRRRYEPQLKADIGRIGEILNSFFFRESHQKEIMEIIHGWRDRDKGIQGGTPHLDAFLLQTKLENYEHSDAGHMWISRKTLIFDALLEKLSGPQLSEFQLMVAASKSEHGDSKPLIDEGENEWKGMGRQLGLGSYGILQGLSVGAAGLFDDATLLTTKVANKGLGAVGASYRLDDPLLLQKTVQSGFDQLTPQVRGALGATSENDVKILGRTADQFGALGGQGVWFLTSLGLGAEVKGMQVATKVAGVASAASDVDDACGKVVDRVLFLQDQARTKKAADPELVDYLEDTDIQVALVSGVAAIASLGLSMTDSKKLKWGQLNRIFRTMSIAAKGATGVVEAKAGVEGIFARMSQLGNTQPLTFETFIADPQIVQGLVNIFGAAFTMGAAAHEARAEAGRRTILSQKLSPTSSAKDMAARQKLMQQQVQITKTQTAFEAGAKGMKFASSVGDTANAVAQAIDATQAHSLSSADGRLVGYAEDKSVVDGVVGAAKSAAKTAGAAKSFKKADDAATGRTGTSSKPGSVRKAFGEALEAGKMGAELGHLHKEAHEAAPATPAPLGSRITDTASYVDTHFSDIALKYDQTALGIHHKLDPFFQRHPRLLEAVEWGDVQIRAAGTAARQGLRLGEGTEAIQKSGHASPAHHDPHELRHDILSTEGRGFNPDTNLRGRLSGALGFDPGQARLHTGPHAASRASEMGAEAFTIGRDVFFGANQFDPHSEQGLGLIAHELTHVMQQTGGGAQQARFFSQSGGDEMEREAQEVGKFFFNQSHDHDAVQIEHMHVDYDMGDHDHEKAHSLDQRLEHISARALELVQELVEPGRYESVQVESLFVEVELDLDKMGDHEAAMTWAQAIIGALPMQRESATMATALQLSAHPSHPGKAKSHKKPKKKHHAPLNPVDRARASQQQIRQLNSKIDAAETDAEKQRLTAQRDKLQHAEEQQVNDLKRLIGTEGFWNQWRSSQEGGVQKGSSGKVISVGGLENTRLKKLKKSHADDPIVQSIGAKKVDELSGPELAHMQELYDQQAGADQFSDPRARAVYLDTYYAYGPGTAGVVDKYREDHPQASEKDIRDELIRYRQGFDQKHKGKSTDEDGDFIGRNPGRADRHDLLDAITQMSRRPGRKQVSQPTPGRKSMSKPSPSKKTVEKQPPPKVENPLAKMSGNERILEAGKRAALLVPGEIGHMLTDMFTLTNLAVIVGTIGLLALLNGTPAGWFLDGALLVWTLATVGKDAVSGLLTFGDGILDARSADTDAKMATAAKKIAEGATKAGVNGLMMFMSLKGAKEAAKGKPHAEAVETAEQQTLKTKSELLADDAAYPYNMADNPGPLADKYMYKEVEKTSKSGKKYTQKRLNRDNPAKNFRGGRYKVEVLEEEVTLYRVGSKDNAFGGWWTREKPVSELQTRSDLAVKETWPNRKGKVSVNDKGITKDKSVIECVWEVKFPKGTTIYEGPAASMGGPYFGGGNQIFIEKPWTISGTSKPVMHPLYYDSYWPK